MTDSNLAAPWNEDQHSSPLKRLLTRKTFSPLASIRRWSLRFKNRVSSCRPGAVLGRSSAIKSVVCRMRGDVVALVEVTTLRAVDVDLHYLAPDSDLRCLGFQC